jgi:hypothetical protein
MTSINFAVPVLTSAQMARQDHIDLTVNQATAAIVCCWLEHQNAGVEKGLVNSLGLTSSSELVSLINAVQGALRTIP